MQQSIFEKFNDIYIQARDVRAFAVSLESDVNNKKAAQKWHLIADSLFDAVGVWDAMTQESSR